ncbi:MAG: hypothetical protein GY791_20505 [Alphaproteobacteria bacterium]|nr:hypothetical protein [Alphaproteobacteria bacterium]
MPLVRLIVDANASCPVISIADRNAATTERKNPHAATFPIKVCEAIYEYGVAGRVGQSGRALPIVKQRPRHIVIFGDTGCYDDGGQDCDRAAAWPFGAMAGWAAGRQPDLLIHVGDYNYRGTPGRVTIDGVAHWVYDAGDGVPAKYGCRQPGPYISQNVSGSDDWDNWPDWRDDFFVPAADLLSVTPLVASRGNHELCSRAGPGWFYLLGPGSPLIGGAMSEQSCTPESETSPIRFVEPYRIDLSGLDLLMVDSANACDQGVLYRDHYTEEFIKVQSLADKDPAWLVTHRPLWGLRGDDRGSDAVSGKFLVINQTLQRALSSASGGHLSAEIDLVLSGHIHVFQALTFEDDTRPPQIFVGNGGIGLPKLELAPDMTADVDGVRAAVMTRDRFGFLEMLVDDDGAWHGRVINPVAENGFDMLAECQSGRPPSGAVCIPGGT